MKLSFSGTGATAASMAMALGIALALTGCTAPNDFPVFDRAQAETDKLPAIFDEIDLTEYDQSTSRFSGEHNGVRYYLILREGGDPIGAPCLAVAAAANPGITCGGPEGLTTSSEADPKYEAQLVPSPATDGDGWRAISDNVRVRD